MIERELKFPLDAEKFHLHESTKSLKASIVRQWYLTEAGVDPTARVRKVTPLGGEEPSVWFLTFKRRLDEITNHETEFEINEHHAKNMVDTLAVYPEIVKTRYYLPVQGFDWTLEIDVFHHPALCDQHRVEIECPASADPDEWSAQVTEWLKTAPSWITQDDRKLKSNRKLARKLHRLGY